MKYHSVIFDLDGTLVDSSKGIIKAVEYAAGKMGLELPDEANLRFFLGPPLRQSFRHCFKLEGEPLEKAVAEFREYYNAQGVYESSLYPGIEEMLEQLHAGGIAMCVATSKMDAYAEQFLGRFAIRNYFDGVFASRPDGSLAEKHISVGEALKLFQQMNRYPAVMVGDRIFDAEGAKRNGIPVIGALWGDAHPEEFITDNVVGLAYSPEDMIRLIGGEEK